jgi:leucyl aminopeptidase
MRKEKRVKIKIECASITEYNCDLLVVNEFEGVKQPGGATGAVDKALGGLIAKLSREGEISGKLGKVTLIHSSGKTRAGKIAVVGLGKREQFNLEAVRVASAAALKKAVEIKAKKVATIVHGVGIGGLDAGAAAQALVEGSVLGSYKFFGYAKEKEDADFKIETLTLVDCNRDKISSLKKGAELGQMVSEAENRVRDLANTPANRLTPLDFARRAGQVARENKLKFTSLDPKVAGMELLWAVARGSKEPPRLVALEYRGNPGSKEKIALIGKGITFDSGGISLKPSKKMDEMKTDMAGAAVVLEVVKLAKLLRLKKNVLAVMPLTENMPSGSASKPGDVVGSLSGYTTEIINTDAEGRMILADAITYAKEKGATRLLDVATLTGGCVIALGDAASGVFGNDQRLIDKVIEVGNRCGQKMWPLPLFDEYKEMLKSSIADIKNSTNTGKASPSTGAAFLARFVGNTPWVHIDIAGTARSDREHGYLPEGATGVPVRTLIEFLIVAN